MPTTKRRALILISSARRLPLVEPADVKSISTGFFLVEMAQVLKEFEDDYEFTFPKADRKGPQPHNHRMGLANEPIEKNRLQDPPACHAAAVRLIRRQKL